MGLDADADDPERGPDVITVDLSSPTPPYEQIRSQIETMVVHGTLPPGERLPTVRQLAADLGIASGTVARAYRDLEARGVVVTEGRRGTVVAPAVPAAHAAARRTELAALATDFIRRATRLGASDAEVRAALQRAVFS